MKKVKLENGALFERYEKKYLLNQTQYQSLRAALAGAMQVDEYGWHTICTAYYDTDDFAVIRRCLEKPHFKQKLRLRSYGVPAAHSTVYVELKKKLGQITYKRRVALGYREALAYLNNGNFPFTESPQILEEIDWYKSRQPLSQKVLLCYDRVALVGNEDPLLRITFDANVRWRSYGMEMHKGDHGAPLLPGGVRLMEIKTMQALPLWLTTILSEHAVYPTGFSKYGTVYTQFLAAEEAMRHAG